MAPQDRDFNRGGYQGNRGGHGGGRPSQGYQERPPEKTLDELWPDYLKNGYFHKISNGKLIYLDQSKARTMPASNSN